MYKIPRRPPLASILPKKLICCFLFCCHGFISMEREEKEECFEEEHSVQDEQ
jgi:hypothetical protein